jgi:hypothetical protein
MHRHGRGGKQGPAAGMDADHETIHTLVSRHDQVVRKVEELANGVRTETTSADAAMADTLRKHAQEMKQRLADGRPIRMFDPLFREIFDNHDRIAMTIEPIPNGVRVTETSEDQRVVALIKAHAKAVSEFAARGRERVQQPSVVPPAR